MTKRWLAWIIDYAFVSLIAATIGVLAGDRLASMWGSALLLIAVLQVLFAGILQSSIGGGRTPGQLFLGLRVVDRQGLPLRPAASLLRALVFYAPSLCGWPLSIAGPTFAGLFILLNAPARQGLHDLAAGAFVTAGAAGPVQESTPSWKPGVAIALVLLLGLVGELIPPPKTPMGKLLAMPGMRTVMFDDKDEPENTTTVGVRFGMPRLDVPLDYRAATVAAALADRFLPRDRQPANVTLQLVAQGPPENDAAQIRAAALTALGEPVVAGASHLTIELQHDWDFGLFYSRERTETVTHTPAEWLASQP